MPTRCISDDNAVATLYLGGQSIKQIAKALQCSGHAVRNSLARSSTKTRSISESKTCKRRTILSSSEKEMLEGLLLGDGCLQLYSRTARLKLTTVHEEFSKHVKAKLRIPSKISPKPACESEIDGRIVHSKEQHPLCSHRDLTLNDWYKRWYPSGHKIIPDDLILTPRVVRYWFYGDGFSSYNGHNGVALGLCTESFTVDECEWLIVLLQAATGAIFRRRKGTNPLTYALTCYKMKQVIHFFDYIGDCELECFQYKWKHPFERPGKYIKATKRRFRKLT